jgi:fluoride exporter
MTREHPLHPSVILVVAAGGAGGAIARHLVNGVGAAPGFPWSTFAINVTGSLLLALLPAFAVVRRRHLLPPLLGTGLLGGFTTMSAFSEETRALVADGHTATAGAYVVATVAACLVAVALADRFSTRSSRAEFEDEEGDL